MCVCVCVCDVYLAGYIVFKNIIILCIDTKYFELSVRKGNYKLQPSLITERHWNLFLNQNHKSDAFP